jgi:hypothetical protein
MKNVFRKIPVCIVVLWLAASTTGVWAQTKPKFHVLAMAEPGGHHIAYSRAARPWLDSMAAKEHFSIDYIDKTDPINEAFLSKYQLIIQLDYVPYAWKPEALAAFEKYIDEGKGGWVGFHHATLLGNSTGTKYGPGFRILWAASVTRTTSAISPQRR